MRILRLDKILDKTGDTRSPHYDKIADGLFTRPVKIGVRAAGWPEHEAEAIIAARVAGASAADIRKLVQRLHEQRKTAATFPWNSTLSGVNSFQPRPVSPMSQCQNIP